MPMHQRMSLGASIGSSMGGMGGMGGMGSMGGMDPLASLKQAQLSQMAQLSQFQQMQLLRARAAQGGGSLFAMAPNDQNFVQASGQQNVFMPGNAFIPRPSAMTPQNNWLHSQAPDRTPHTSTPVGMPPGVISHAQPTTFVNVYQVPSAYAMDPYFGGAQNMFQ
mmetsp:Transcript_66811/g.56733  ORF Transcript_66811/g.56733 Transcript_66811/m.56733 type:complete len:164 (+) Transcript_66811:1-492(+)